MAASHIHPEGGLGANGGPRGDVGQALEGVDPEDVAAVAERAGRSFVLFDDPRTPLGPSL